MRIPREALFISVVVRRVGVGAAPFTWAIERTDVEASIHLSTERYRSMESAYRAGQARLADFIPRRSLPAGITENRRRESRPVLSEQSA